MLIRLKHSFTRAEPLFSRTMNLRLEPIQKILSGLVLPFLMLCLLGPGVLAQAQISSSASSSVSSAPTILVQGPLKGTPDAREAASGVIEGWLGGEFNVTATQLQRSDQLERVLIQLLRFTPVPLGAKTNLELVKLLEVDRASRRETYRYPVASSGSDFVVDVTVTPSKNGSGWEAYSVRLGSSGPTLPPELLSPVTPWVFGLATLLLIYGVTRPTLWRRWLVWGLSIAREQRRVFLWVNVALYGVFVLGTLASLALPALAREVSDAVGSSLSGTGILSYLEQGVPQAASAITYWNFTQGALETTFLPGLLFGIPALLINLGRFVVLGFGISPTLLPTVAYLLHIPTIVVELQAYIFVTASSMALLWRGRKVGWRVAFRDYLYSLPVALTLLVFAAWYEAIEVLLLIPLLTR